MARLTQHGAVMRIWHGPAFVFPAALPESGEASLVTEEEIGVLVPHFEGCQHLVSEGLPIAAVVRDGKAVSICCTARYSESAHEAGVETVESYRGKGLAGMAVAAWAEGVRGMGRRPMYSTAWDNTASRAVARKLDLLQYGSDFHVT